MKKHLIFKDDKSNKFWEIEVTGTSFTITYGKAGTDGQTSTKEFDTEEKCMKEAEKLVNEKMKKGYEEGNAPTDLHAYLTEWGEIIDAKDLQKALVNHFSYLADNDEVGKIIKAVMQEATKATIDENCLRIEFTNNNILLATAPAEKKEYKEWPNSFQKAAYKHRFLEYGDKDSSIRDLILGDHTLYMDSYLGDDDFENALSPMIDDQSNWWIYHPKGKNQEEEPLLYYVSHDGGGANESFSLNVGSLFIKRIAESLKINFAPLKEKTEEKSTKGVQEIEHVVLPTISTTATVREVLRISDDGYKPTASFAGDRLVVFANCEEIITLNHSKEVLSRIATGRIDAENIAVSENGRYMVSGAGSLMTSALWDLHEGKMLKKLLGEMYVKSSSISKDGYVLLVKEDIVYKWNLASLELIHEKKVGSSSGIKTFTPDGSHLLCERKERIEIYEMNLAKKITTLAVTSPVIALSATNGANKVVALCKDRSIFLWDGDKPCIKFTDPSIDKKLFFETANLCAISPDGNLIAYFLRDDKRISLINITKRSICHIEKTPTFFLLFSPASDYLVIGGYTEVMEIDLTVN